MIQYVYSTWYKVMNLISVYGTLKLASLCQSVMDLAASNLTSLSPSAAISAVSSLAHEHSQLREKLASTNEQLEEVSIASNSIVAELIQIGLMTQLYIHIFISYIWHSFYGLHTLQYSIASSVQILEMIKYWRQWTSRNGEITCVYMYM